MMGVKLWVFMAVLGIAIYIAEFAVCVARLAFISFAAIGANYLNLVFTIACGDF